MLKGGRLTCPCFDRKKYSNQSIMVSDHNQKKVPLLRDERFWRVALQVLAVVIVVLVIAILVSNLNQNMQRAGISFGFGFLQNTASFGIGDLPISYTPADPYLRALFVGMINSIRIMISGIILTTIVGVTAGVMSFSENWLVRQISKIYVEIVRNTPLLLQLFFWYFAVFFSFPQVENKIELFGSIYLSKRRIAIPWPANTVGVWISLGILVALAVGAFFLWKYRTEKMVQTGASGKQESMILMGMGIGAIALIIWGLNWQFPQSPDPSQIEGGLQLSIEFSAILAGLVFYTGAFIAEIVRGGIQSVPKGQWEAARSLGLKANLVMQLVVFPQALRAIIPALNSQYLNLAKNSSLAVAVGFPDIYSVSNTTFNQTGRPIEVFLLIMAFYLSISLIISLVMNRFNTLVQLKD